MTETKKKLLALQKEGKWVFHGTAKAGLKTLRPRQPYNWPTPSSKKVKHGRPCVAAATVADIAIFMAIFHEDTIQLPMSCGFSATTRNGNTTVRYRANSREVLRRGKKASGIVYIFKKEKFHPFGGAEWRAYKPVRPTGVIKVSGKDLPKRIRVTNIFLPPQHKISDERLSKQ